MTDLLIPQKYARKCVECKHLDTRTTLHDNYHPCRQPDNLTEGTLVRLHATECQFFEQLKSKVMVTQTIRRTKQAFQALTTQQLTLDIGEPTNGK